MYRIEREKQYFLRNSGNFFWSQMRSVAGQFCDFFTYRKDQDQFKIISRLDQASIREDLATSLHTHHVQNFTKNMFCELCIFCPGCQVMVTLWFGLPRGRWQITRKIWLCNSSNLLFLPYQDRTHAEMPSLSLWSSRHFHLVGATGCKEVTVAVVPLPSLPPFSFHQGLLGVYRLTPGEEGKGEQ